MVRLINPCAHRSELTSELADKIVKVPEMAESITEGTLKQWSKSLLILLSLIGAL